MKSNFFRTFSICQIFLIIIIIPLFSDDSSKLIGSYKISQFKINGELISMTEQNLNIYFQFAKENRLYIRIDANNDGVFSKNELLSNSGIYKFSENANKLSISGINDAWNGDWEANITIIPWGFQMQMIDQDGNTIYMLFIRL